MFIAVVVKTKKNFNIYKNSTNKLLAFVNLKIKIVLIDQDIRLLNLSLK